jgi:formamidopyrimidine-DNA glycosylase
VGATVAAIERRGKNILIRLSNGQVLVVHLKMTGRLTFERSEADLRKHTHFVLDLDVGQLRFNDTRRFGYLDLAEAGELDSLEYLSGLGPDALYISEDDFVALVRSKRRIIKSLLLDQAALAGMGNIYSDEALFLAGIHPRRVSSTLSPARAARLHKAMIEVLRRAIASRGSTLNDYVDARGRKGDFQKHHMVYGREGEPCRRCGRHIRREIIGSRSSHFCSRCQR